MLPREPEHAEFEFGGRMCPATEVGGDFFDVLTNHERLWLTIDDVSSHGLGAGLVMMITQTAFQSVFEGGRDLGADEAAASTTSPRSSCSTDDRTILLLRRV